MSEPSLFTWRHLEVDIILCAVRWYLRSALRSRDIEELLRERGVWVDHTTVLRWGPRDAPELYRRCRPSRRATHGLSRVDAPSITITQPWHDLYRAVDSAGATLHFMVSTTRDADAAERVFREGLQASQTRTPRVITVDTHAASPLAFDALQHEGTLPQRCRLRHGQELNTMGEQDHRCVKRRVHPGVGCGACATAQRTMQGDAARPMRHTGQLEGVTQGDVLASNRVINQVFGVAAS
jgi:transposase-like protein